MSTLCLYRLVPAELMRVSADTFRRRSHHSREKTMVCTALSTDNEPKSDAR